MKFGRNRLPGPPWMQERILHFFHPLTLLPPPCSRLLKIAHYSYKRSLHLTASLAPYAPVLPLLGTLRPGGLYIERELGPWHEVGIDTLGDLYSDSKLLSIDVLQEQYGIHSGQFIIYHSLMHRLLEHWRMTSEPEAHQVIQYLHVMGTARHLITWFVKASREHTQTP